MQKMKTKKNTTTKRRESSVLRGPLITFFPRDYSHWLVRLAKVSQVELLDQWGFRRRGSDLTNGETVRRPWELYF